MIGVGRRDLGSAAPGSSLPSTTRHASRGVRGGAWTALDLAALDPDDERPYWIVLAAVPGLGPVSFAHLIERYGSARAAWAAGARAIEDLPRVHDEGSLALRRLRREGALRAAARITDNAAAAGGLVVTALDDAYPAALSRLDPRPPVLYLSGDRDAMAATCVAVVGTRRASAYGRSSAIAIGDELARAEVTVVSGLALGIDGEAHRAAIAAGGRSVAVLPTPIDRIYPPRHRGLAQQLVATGGALVSELPPGAATGRPDFARRNRVIAGLATATVVVEAPDRSGALLTAQAALDYGRDLYAVPGGIDAAASSGCNRLIADHTATLVTSPAALLHLVGARRGSQPVSVASLSEVEALVLGTLLGRSASIEELMARTRYPTGAVASALTLLEARGLVTAYGGATFHPTLAARRIGRESLTASSTSTVKTGGTRRVGST
jgi:DNA processing protein